MHSQAESKLEVIFGGTPTPGEFKLRVHLLSTSVVGVDRHEDVSFKMVEDDVPALEDDVPPLE